MLSRLVPASRPLRYMRTGAPLVVLLVVLWIEAGRRSGDPVPIPFLTLYAAVILAASASGLRGGLLAGALAGAFVAYSAEVGFGPHTLTGDARHVALGIGLYALSGGIVGFRTDRRQRALHILRRSAAVSLSDALAEGYVVIDTDGAIVDANQRLADILRLPLDRILGRRLTNSDLGITYLTPQGEPADVTGLPLARAVATGQTQHDELIAVRRIDGSVIDLRINIAPEAGTDTPEYFVTTVTDVTARVEDERELARLNRELAEQSAERQALVQQLLTAQEEERQTVAYEIHDGPAQQLAAAQMFLEAFEHESIPGGSSDYLDQARRHLGTGLRETRRIMSGLRPALLDDVGLREALNTLVTDSTIGTGIELEFHVDHLRQSLPPEVEITLYRIVQEAVANALKHSNTSYLSVRLTSDPTCVTVTVSDHGTGFVPESLPAPREGRHFGLVGMRERVALLGGEFSVDSSPPRGTSVSASIPLNG
jgi:PAS domain S-box-containing protein